MIPWFLMSSYAYYEENNPIFSDYFFDNLTRDMIEYWNELKHQHKHLISLDDLSAGTYMGYYPPIVIGALKELRKCSA